MLERSVQKKVVTYAKRQGCLAYKWNSDNHRGVPDYLFFFGGRTLMIEFKAPGKLPSPLQLREHSILRHGGMTVGVVDDVAQGCALLQLFIHDALDL